MAHKSVETIDAAIRRWQRRLTRAANTLSKLQKTRARLIKLGTMPTKLPVAKVPKPEAPLVVHEPTPELVVVEFPPEFKDEVPELPEFLDRRNPVIAEEMTAKRKAAEAEARKQMPLTGRAALDAVKRKPKKQ